MTFMTRLLIGAFAAVFEVVLAAQPVVAEPLAPPAGPVVLTVKGAISSTNVADTASLDLPLLQSMGTVTITTTTIWTDGPQRFEGVSLHNLLAALGAKGTSVQAMALNDYAVDIPITDAIEGGPILAFRMNDVMLSPRDKGPIWLIYPYDSNPEYQSEVVYSRSIWQLDRMEVLP